MRILMLPLIGLSQITSDSDYLIYRDLIYEINRINKDWFFYLVLPKGREEQITEILPNTEIIWTKMSADFFEESMKCPDDVSRLFNRRSGKYLIDLIITTRVGGSAIMQGVLSDFRRKDVVPCVIIEAMVRAWSRPNFIDASLRAMSYCSAYTWLLSSEEKVRALKLMKKSVSSAMIDKFLTNCKILNTGVRVQQIDDGIKNIEKSKKFSLFFGGRFSKEKRPDIMSEFTSRFYQYGRDVNVYITTQHTSSRKLMKYENESAFSTIKKECSRKEFFEIVAKSHVFVCTSDDESFPSGFFEQLYILQVGIFPDKKWVRATLPKNYPFIYKDKIEGHTMLRWIYDNYDEALKKVSWIRDWIIKEANYKISTKEIVEWIEQVPTPYLEFGKSKEDSLRGLILDVAKKMPDMFDFDDFLIKLGDESRAFNPHQIAKNKFPSKYEIYRTLLDNGYKDTYKLKNVILKKYEKN